MIEAGSAPANDNQVHKLESPFEYNNGQTPLVMAYIGDDDPNRGDSNGSVGIAKLMAEMMGGRYVYVDVDVMKRHFKETSYTAELLKKYMVENGSPDIVLGNLAHEIRKVAPKQPCLKDDSINECRIRPGQACHVPHHLTDELLAEGKKDFNARYPDIKGTLVAVLMSDVDPENIKEVAKKARRASKHYDDITFFVCPSRRTYETGYKKMVQKLKRARWRAMLRNPFGKKRGHIHVLGKDYDGCVTDYNPYTGLLARADHVIVVGRSHSIMSEAAFRGKSFYYSAFGGSKEWGEGIGLPLSKLGNGAFVSKNVPRVDATYSRARELVDLFYHRRFPSTGVLSLTFKCAAESGEGRFSRMRFPGRDSVPEAPEDWPGPGQMAPGSLNCRIQEFPADFDNIAGAGDRIQKLDSGYFIPEFSIPGELIQNNALSPTQENPQRGIAQIWRCRVYNEDSRESFNAWHVRRIDGSYPAYHDVIELMADRNLRKAHNIQDGTPLTITMFGRRRM